MTANTEAMDEFEKLVDRTAWRPMESAPKDGTLLFLMVDADQDSEDSSNPTENEMSYRTIGSNNFDHDGDDVWRFAGWCWQHDHWVEGRGTPSAWMPLPDPPYKSDP